MEYNPEPRDGIRVVSSLGRFDRVNFGLSHFGHFFFFVVSALIGGSFR